MRVVLSRSEDPKKRGAADEWTAAIDGLRPGIGRTRTEALGSLLGANLEAFGVAEYVDDDHAAATREVRWAARGGA